MIAVPVVVRDKGVLKSVNLFTKAKTFALLDENGGVELLEHGHDSGKVLAQDLIGRGVRVLITGHIGKTPYELLRAAGVSIVHARGSFELPELLGTYRQGGLEPLAPEQVHASRHQHQTGEGHDCDCAGED